ncbi:GNAT family N-acetyltransferase [Magnetococcales bacterium HHB-1]
MKISFQKIAEKHAKDIIDILNYYIKNSFSAIRDDTVGYEYFQSLNYVIKSYPTIVALHHEEIIGFGFLHAFHPANTVSKTAMITYFIKPEFTGHGIGSTMLDKLCAMGQKQGITNIIAQVVSLNEKSIAFHKKHGFKICGQFEHVGHKHGRNFSITLLQKQLLEHLSMTV